ncbi:hypothetical protein PXK56_18530 [Phaeobacter gallaeciensis]|uniref:hypothetical protein n=1 Tax=Phaeobacter gallaeciensis TaxID=60890 RepID=UPI0023809296|nr:hypothetical protein [Phaeobacter gallaeciensis]MDE4297184.1 hypothetical protein [Phaeobacter gallaeciensis]
MADFDDRTPEDRIVARCIIDELNPGPNGPGFYYSLTDGDGNESEPLGPFESKEAAENAFMAAMEQAATDMVKKTLGLEN